MHYIFNLPRATLRRAAAKISLPNGLAQWSRFKRACAGLSVVSFSALAAAQVASPTVAFLPVATDTPSTTNGADTGSEPAVKYTSIEDDGARIDELRVRGQTQRITVTPKTGGRPYEILTPAHSYDLHEAPNGVRGAAGKRVWHMLSF